MLVKELKKNRHTEKGIYRHSGVRSGHVIWGNPICMFLLFFSYALQIHEQKSKNKNMIRKKQRLQGELLPCKTDKKKRLDLALKKICEVGGKGGNE